MIDFAFLGRLAPVFLKGSVVTLWLTALSVSFGLALGLAAALGRLSRLRPLRRVAGFYTWFIRGTPLLVQIMLIHFGLPQVTGIVTSRPVSAVLALSINAGAYIAEILRAGIQSIDRGQMEAARSLGMSYGQAMRRIIIPQTYRRVVPPLSNEFIAMLKDSSLVATIGMEELMRKGQVINAATGRSFFVFVTAAVFYLAMTTLFTALGAWLEKRLSVYE